jgi:ATPase subunit of ABC transporter with duplicated ATPase domains
MLKILNLSFSHLAQIIFENINLSIGEGMKVALIGDNGTGKTTLLNLIAEELEPDSGSVFTSGNIAYLKQDNYKLFPKLSGGQRTQEELERVFYAEVDSNILLLDEPTNNLDEQAAVWLEKFLFSFKGAVLFASHDRAFIDKVATHIVKIQNKKLVLYAGNYSTFLLREKQVNDEQTARYNKAQKEKRKLALMLKNARDVSHKADNSSFNKKTSGRFGNLKVVFNTYKNAAQTNAGKQISTINTEVSRIEKIKKPIEKKVYQAAIGLAGTYHKKLLYVEKLLKRFGELTVFSGVSFDIFAKERIHLSGKNGSGKSTLLKIIVGELEVDAGIAKISSGVKVGYLSQDLNNLDFKKTALDNLLDEFSDKTIVITRATTMDLSLDDLNKPVEKLSRGQQTKVSFLRLLLGGYDLLILDEPTNHIDIWAKDNIETALEGYEGAVLIASHDRYFVEKLKVNRIIKLS